jgi:hypothetical protein
LLLIERRYTNWKKLVDKMESVSLEFSKNFYM